jgi:outer membrane protein TolC
VLIFTLFLVALGGELREKDAVFLGLRSATDLKVSQIELTIDSLSEESVRAKRLPSLDLSSSIGYTPLDSAWNSGAAAGETDSGGIGSKKSMLSSSVGASLSVPLPGGGRVNGALTENVNRDISDNDTEYETDLAVSFSQPLLRNAWRNADIDYEIRIARIDHRRATQEWRKGVAGTISEIRSLYWDWYEKHELVAIAKNTKEYAERQRTIERERFAVGEATAIDTLSAYLEYLKASQNLLAAQAQQVVAKNAFTVTVLADSDTLSLPHSMTIDIISLPPPRQLIVEAQEYDPQLEIFSLVKSKLKMQYEKRRNDLLPAVAVEGSYGRRFSGDELFRNNRSFASSALFSLIVSYSIPNRTRRIAQESVEFSAEINEKRREEYWMQLFKRVEDLTYNWDIAMEKLSISATSKAIAKKYLDATQEGFRLGTVDALTLMKARNDYEDVAVKYVQDQIQMKRLEIVFDEISGRLFTRFGVTMP